MAKVTTVDLRNVAVVGHGDTGKTTLVSACLYTTGAVNRMGLVDQGTTTTDYDPEEVERQISIQAALAHCNFEGKHVTFIDTPGYSVFRPDTKASVRVADSFALLIDAVSGPQVMSDKSWQYSREYKTPGFIAINRLDRENSSYQRTLEAIQARFGREAVALQIPIGKEHDFSGVVDLVEMKAFSYKRDGDGRASARDIPEELQATAESQREALVEMVAEGDETLMEVFFEEGDLTPEQLAKGIRTAVRDRLLFPVLCTSALHGIGTDRVLATIVNYLPSPDERADFTGANAKDKEEASWPIDPEGPFAALVFKTVADPYAGRISLMKVFSGSASIDAPMLNPRSNTTEKLANLSLVQGKQYEPTQGVVAGQLCAVAKLRDIHTSDTLCDKSQPIIIDPVEFPKAAISFAVEPQTQADEEKISEALARLCEEDATIAVNRDPQTHELLVSGLGQLHVEVTVAKLEKRFGVKTRLKPPTVPYRETIRGTARAEGRHKKQSGGRGQFGVCVIELSPNDAGEGFEFEDKIFGGSIPQQFRPAVQKGVQESAARGVLCGFPLEDFRCALLDGKFHAVDSSEIAFKIAGSMAFKEAALLAQPTLMEPLMDIEISIPDDAMGDVMGDLNSRRGRVQGMEPAGGHQQMIKAQIPLAEVLTYAPDLNSLTGGRGTYTMEFSHYDEVPAHLSQKIIDDIKAKREAEAG
ncbi:MAG: elongation factor G [Acidobacteriota bacterium]|nr:elongation factor G [Acidobacteriota bacterium]